MKSKWSLPDVLERLHKDVQNQLETARTALGNNDAKGDASEEVWLSLFKNYLPKRYQSEKAYVVDSSGTFSDQMDVVVFDRQYSPFIFDFMGQKIVPAESVYAAFEAKQSINAGYVKYAQEKLASVRSLCRTSLPIPHAGGKFCAKPLIEIIGGILTLESEWADGLSQPLTTVLKEDLGSGVLDIGCVASHGIFTRENDSEFLLKKTDKATTSFLFELIARLQQSGTVPMLDVRAYAKFL